MGQIGLTYFALGGAGWPGLAWSGLDMSAYCCTAPGVPQRGLVYLDGPWLLLVFPEGSGQIWTSRDAQLP